MGDAAKQVLAEVIDYFADNEESPGDWWAPSEDRTSLGLDWRASHEGRKFWIDLDKDGTVTIYWKRPGGESSVVRFCEQSSQRFNVGDSSRPQEKS